MELAAAVKRVVVGAEQLKLAIEHYTEWYTPFPTDETSVPTIPGDVVARADAACCGLDNHATSSSSNHAPNATGTAADVGTAVTVGNLQRHPIGTLDEKNNA